MDLNRTPYMREVLDCLGDDRHTEVALVKAAQVGGSEAAKTAIGAWVDSNADSILLVLPNQKTAEEHVEERIFPMLKEKRLARWVTNRTHDLRKGQVNLAHMTIYVGWSGSPQSLASRAIKYAIFDETDKSADHGREANTVDLVRDRLLTYGDRSKLFILSTPTVKGGPIWQSWLGTSDRRKFHVPCPHCGEFQPLEWEHVRWDRRDEEDSEELLKAADALLSGAIDAWYDCQGCHERIEERARLGMVQRGEWISELGDDPRSSRVAFHISALYSPWVTMARTVAEFLRGRVAHDMRNFYNSFLGLPSEEYLGSPKVETLKGRRRDPAFVCPRWATSLTAGADTQVKNGKPYWFWVVRAWGPNLKSRLIAWGKAHAEAELYDCTIDATYPVEGGGYTMRPLVVCVDSGGAVELKGEDDASTTDLVYRMARNDPARVIPVKGHGGVKRPDRLISSANVDYQPPQGAPSQVLLHRLDTQGLKDILSKLIRAEDPILWEESAIADDVYLSHMTAEEKTRVRVGRKFHVRWVNNTRRRNDLWDASVYCLAAAKMIRADDRRESGKAHEERLEAKTGERQHRQPQRKTKPGWVRKHGRQRGWVSKR